MRWAHCTHGCGLCWRYDDDQPVLVRTCIICHAPFDAEDVDSEYQTCPACTMTVIFTNELRDRKAAN
jgi:hypothetical protein